MVPPRESPALKRNRAKPIRAQMHREPPRFVDHFVGYAVTAGKIYGAVLTLYHVGRACGTAVRVALHLLGLLQRMYGRALHHAARQIRHHVGAVVTTARHYAQRLDLGVNLASRVFAAAHLVLKDIAPAYEQKASKGAAPAKESYSQMKGGYRGPARSRAGPREKAGRRSELAGTVM